MLAVDLIYQCIPNPFVSRIIGLEWFFFFFFFECSLPFFPLMDYNPLPSLSLFFCKERGLIWQSVCGKGELVILVCDGN